jgi:hypothetical protein
MPVLRNDGTAQVTVVDKNGNARILSPGETLETYFFSSNANVTVVSHAPVWTRVVSRAEIDLSDIDEAYQSDISGFSGAVVPVSAETDQVYILKITGEITVYKQATSVTPEMKDRDDASPYIAIDARQTMTRLLISGTGEVEVVQYRRPL